MSVQAYEAVLIVLYVLCLRPAARITVSAKDNRSLYALGAVWVLSITVSFITSPLSVGMEILGHLRYQQTLLHVMFFLALRDLLGHYPAPRHWILLMIPASAFVVAVVLAFLAYRLDSYDAVTASQWFAGPPLNGHIRHTGYQVAAAIAALIPFFLLPRRAQAVVFPLFVVLATLCTFMFWMGGRASILSVCAAFAFVAIVAAVKGVRSRTLWLVFALAMIIGIVLAEAFAVFPWNGVLSSVTRTVEAGSLTQVSSGRLDLWRESWESVRDHLAFGLGPQGYLFMPNRSFGVQPHSFLVQFLVEWGIIGSVLFLGLLALGVWRGAQNQLLAADAPLDLPAMSAGAIIVSLTVHGLVDGTYYHPQPSLYLAIAFAIWTLPRLAPAVQPALTAPVRCGGS